MASAKFTAVDGGGSVSYSDGNAMSYSTAGAYCSAIEIGGLDFDIQSVYSPGVDGGGTKDYGFRTQTIKLDIIYVKSSEADCADAWNTDSGIFGTVSTLVANGITFNGCICQRGTRAMQPKSTGLESNTYRMDAVINVLCTRL